MKREDLLWILSLSCFLFVITARYLLNVWMPALFIPLIFSFFSFSIWVYYKRILIKNYFFLNNKNKSSYWFISFFIWIIGLIGFNGVIQKWDYFKDFSEGAVNSLSSDSLEYVKRIRIPIHIRILYKESLSGDEKDRLRELLSFFERENSLIQSEWINIYTEEKKARKYLKNEDLYFQSIMLLESPNRKIRLSYPYDEAQITSGFIRLLEEKTKKIYFTQGHGERSLEENTSSEESIHFLGEALKDLNRLPLPLNLMEEKGSLPVEVETLAIIGPHSPFFKEEIEKIHQFLRRGGKLFIALDPGYSKELYQVLNPYGIHWSSQYLVNDQMTVSGRGLSGAIGSLYHQSSPFTQGMNEGNKYTLFDLASSLTWDFRPDTEVSVLVQTPKSTFVMEKTQTGGRGGDGSFKKQNVQPQRDSSVLGLAVKGKEHSYEIVAFGDSDFLSNKDWNTLFNRELSLKVFSALTAEQASESIPILITGPQPTSLILTPLKSRLLIVSFLFIPFFFTLLTGYLYFKKRESHS